MCWFVSGIGWLLWVLFGESDCIILFDVGVLYDVVRLSRYSSVPVPCGGRLGFVCSLEEMFSLLVEMVVLEVRFDNFV